MSRFVSSRASRLSGSVGSLLGKLDLVSPLLHQAERLRRMQQELDQIVPPTLAQGCHVASLRQGTVIVRVSNNAAAAKLRLFGPRLLALFQASGGDVKSVKVEVQFLTPPTGGPSTTNRNVIPPPRKPLRDLADALPDSRLRDALESLANKARAGD